MSGAMVSSHVVIPCRYGSVRLPGKPLADIGGEPMFYRVYQSACRSKAQSVVVATDDERIADACISRRVPFVMTSRDIATGTDRAAFVARQFSYDGIVVNVQGDQPFIDHRLIDRVIDGCVGVDACTACSDEDDGVRVLVDHGGWIATEFSRAAVGGYKHIGLYAYTAAALEKFAALRMSAREKTESLEQLRALEVGMRIRVVLYDGIPMPEVNTEHDLIEARAVFNELEKANE